MDFDETIRETRALRLVNGIKAAYRRPSEGQAADGRSFASAVEDPVVVTISFADACETPAVETAPAAEPARPAAFAETDDIAAFAETDDIAAFAETDDIAAFAETDDIAAFAETDDIAAFAETDAFVAVAAMGGSGGSGGTRPPRRARRSSGSSSGPGRGRRHVGAKAAVALAGTAALLVGSAGMAFANAANPAPTTTGSAIVNADGTVSVSLSGTWVWPGQDCAGRYGEGYSVDWWGVTTSPTAANFSLSDASQVNGFASSTTGPMTSDGSITYTAGGTYFHVAEDYVGQDVNSAATCTDTGSGASAGSTGAWAASATYPAVADVPPQLCVIMYDEHGKEGQVPTDSFGTDKNFHPLLDTDNSIDTNAFNPATPGYCLSTSFVPSVTVAKTGPATGIAGDQGTYDITATNSGTGPTTGSTVFADTLPTGESYVSVASTSGAWTCSAASQIVTCTDSDTIAANGGSAEAAVTVSYASNTGGQTLTDCATTNGQANPSCVPTNIPGAPGVTVAKTGPATGTAGGDGTYGITATNSGTAATTGSTVFTDTLPTGETYVSAQSLTGAWTCSAASQVVTCTDTSVIGASGGTASANVTVSYASNTGGQTLTDCATTNGQANPSCVPTNIPGAPGVTVAKIGPASGTAGGDGTYTITATNSGTAATTGSTVFTDTLPTGETYVSAQSLTGAWTCSAASQVVTCTDTSVIGASGGTASANVTVSYASNTGGQTLTDCATTNGQANPSCVPTNIPGAPGVTVAKTGPATGTAGGDGTYGITATNSGTAATTGSTVFTDTLPTGETYVSAQSLTGAWTCSAASQVVTCTDTDTIAASGGTASANVTVSYASNTGGQTLTDCATTNGQANPSCVPTNIPGTPGLTVVKTGPAVGAPGDQGTYTLKVTNGGTGASTAQDVTDLLPTGETYVSDTDGCTATGQSLSCPVAALAASTSTTFNVTVSYGSATAGQALTDCASVGAGTPCNGCATVGTTCTSCPNTGVSCVTTDIVDVGVVKTNNAADPAGTSFLQTETAPTLGEAFTYQAVITNNSLVSETITSISDVVGSNASAPVTCTNAGGPVANTTVLTPGESVTCQFAGTAPNTNSASLSDTITVTAASTTTPADTTTANSTSTVLTPGAASLTVVKTGPAVGAPGDQGTYTLKVTNGGTGASTAQDVTDLLPTGETYVSDTDGCTATGQSLSCPVAALAASASTTFNVTVSYGSATAGQALTDCASVGAGTPATVAPRWAPPAPAAPTPGCPASPPTSSMWAWSRPTTPPIRPVPASSRRRQPRPSVRPSPTRRS